MTLTAKELGPFIGITGLVQARGEMHVRVEVIDVRSNYGRRQFQVKPLAGTRDTWIDEASLIRE